MGTRFTVSDSNSQHVYSSQGMGFMSEWTLNTHTTKHAHYQIGFAISKSSVYIQVLKILKARQPGLLSLAMLIKNRNSNFVLREELPNANGVTKSCSIAVVIHPGTLR